MRKIFAVFLVLFMTAGLFIHTAEAARFGGGRSFGMQRSIGQFSSYSRYSQPNRAYSQSATTPNRWLGALTGLAAGGVLASLFMGHGFGGGLLSWLVIIGIGFILWSLFRGKLQSVMQSTQYNQPNRGNIYEAESYFTRNKGYSNENSAPQYPAGFDADLFLREAKVQFIRLQAAYDVKDLNDLREFTAPEVFAEIQMQLQERGQELNKTEIISLNSELVDVTLDKQSVLASVKFSGTLREKSDAPAISFHEAWHFRKDDMRDTWMVVGVQQQIG